MAIENQSPDPCTIQDPKLQQPDEKSISSSNYDLESVVDIQPPFSVFTKWQKRWISLLTSFAAMFSTLSSYIYYPALVPIAKELGVSITLINLTVTSYLIIAAVAPAFMGDMADQSGRRPIYILMFALYFTANLGIALQKSFPALLVLRMLQSAGSSGLIGAAYGVVADITTVRDRGAFVGILLLLTDVAPSLGPVIGGAFTQTLGWRWIFWFLVILTGSHFFMVVLFLPETQRNIVGDGSGEVRGVYWSFFSLFQSSEVKKNRAKVVKPKRHYPNPFACLPILANKESLIVILIYAVTYSVKMALQTSLGAQCVEIYQLDYLYAGLIYVPSGIAGGIGSFMTGIFLDRQYRKTTANLSGDPDQHGTSPDFPIEKTRLTGIYILITISAFGTLGYGLSLLFKTHIAVMLIMQFLTGMTTASTFTMTSTLLTDLNAHRSSTAQAASSIVRCLGAAVAIAVMQPLANAVGLGWCFAVYAILVLSEVPLVWVLLKNGVRWRKERACRDFDSK